MRTPLPAPVSEDAGLAAPVQVHRELNRAGRPLEAPVRGWMQDRFALDFSRIRIHDDDGAASSARAVGAHAYTVGHHIVFGAGQFRPHSPQGLRLLAHELTHVAQQSAGGAAVQAFADEGARTLSVEPVDAPAERQAEAAADLAVRGLPVSASLLRLPSPKRLCLQRHCNLAPCPTGPRVSVPSSSGIGSSAGKWVGLQYLGAHPVSSYVAIDHWIYSGSGGPKDMNLSGLGPSATTKLGQDIDPPVFAAMLANSGRLNRADILDSDRDHVYEVKPRRGAGSGGSQLQGYLNQLRSVAPNAPAWMGGRPRAWAPGPWAPNLEPLVVPSGDPQLHDCHVCVEQDPSQPGVLVYDILCCPTGGLPVPITVPGDRPDTGDEKDRVLHRDSTFEQGLALAFVMGMAALMARFASRRGAMFLLGRLALPLGLILLVTDLAQAADKLSRGAQFGFQGAEDIPKGMEGIDGDFMMPEGISQEEIQRLATREFPPAVLAAVSGDKALQEFLWRVGRQRGHAGGQPMSAEELRALSALLQQSDPRSVQLLQDFLAAGDPKMQQAAGVLRQTRAAAGPGGPSSQGPVIQGPVTQGPAAQGPGKGPSQGPPLPDGVVSLGTGTPGGTSSVGVLGRTGLGPGGTGIGTGTGTGTGTGSGGGGSKVPAGPSAKPAGGSPTGSATGSPAAAGPSKPKSGGAPGVAAGGERIRLPGLAGISGVESVTQIPAEEMKIRSFALLAGLEEHRLYGPGQQVYITIRVEADGETHDIGIPILVDRRGQWWQGGERITEVKGRVKGHWRVLNTGRYLPAGAPISYTWRYRPTESDSVSPGGEP